eukprot:6483564-Amphidinium_carterae.2
MERAGQRQGKFSPCPFASMITKRMGVRLCPLGPKDDKIVALLNRIIELKTDGETRQIQYEPDPRHVQIALAELGLGTCKPVGSTDIPINLHEQPRGMLRDTKVELQLLRVHGETYLIRASSSTQAIQTLSSAEAEFLGLPIIGCSRNGEGLGDK